MLRIINSLLSKFLKPVWKILRPILEVGLVLLVIILIWLYYHKRTITVQPTVKTITKIKTIPNTQYKYVYLTQYKLRYIPVDVYKKITNSTNVPSTFTNSHILATGNVAPYAGQTNVTCILDKKGNGSLYFKQLPYTKTVSSKSLFSIKPVFSIGAGYGLWQGNPTTKVSVGYRFIRIANISIKAQDDLYAGGGNVNNWIGAFAKMTFR